MGNSKISHLLQIPKFLPVRFPSTSMFSPFLSLIYHVSLFLSLALVFSLIHYLILSHLFSLFLGGSLISSELSLSLLGAGRWRHFWCRNVIFFFFFLLRTAVTSVMGNLWQRCGLTSGKRRFLQKKNKIREKDSPFGQSGPHSVWNKRSFDYRLKRSPFQLKPSRSVTSNVCVWASTWTFELAFKNSSLCEKLLIKRQFSPCELKKIVPLNKLAFVPHAHMAEMGYEREISSVLFLLKLLRMGIWKKKKSQRSLSTLGA